ncbi:hypothetical protein SAMN05421780_11138 [Flexibacter flexilis DSM 6793]|uniref:Uncharacterized protein n=1 Tax=Flexibacter flexilis DSM 6793 TaxID=927664 RepID=A0A1I1MXS3_9BACT|nr:hypothetical protein [Flexibacter flexilis]SFC87363.1 hypothetical protein SAMN05421780_11138 [Flexibacter flexilis DSM 6793]
MIIPLDKTTCPNCGNKLTFNPETQSLGCELCNQVSDIQEEYIENIKYNIIPFQLSKKQIENLFYDWLVNNNNTIPVDILEKTTINFIHGQYLPTWTFQVFHEEELKKYHELTYAGDTQSIEPNALRVLDYIKVKPALIIPYEEKYSMGFDISALVQSKETAWQNYIKRLGAMGVYRRLESEMDFCYVPIWTVKYTYENKEYIVCIDGITGRKKKGIAPVEQLVIDRKKSLKKANISLWVFTLSFLLFAYMLISERIKIIDGFTLTIFFGTMFGSFFYMIYNVFMLLFIKTKFRIGMRRDKVLKEFSLRLAEKK